MPPDPIREAIATTPSVARVLAGDENFSDADILESDKWPAPGSEDTELGCFDGAGGGSWRDGSLPASSNLRLCA
jgi:hypothetical protein